MTDPEKTALKEIGKSQADLFINLGLAFGASFVISRVLGLMGTELWDYVDLALFFAIIFGDPAACWRKGSGWKAFGLKFALSGVCGLGLSWIINSGLMSAESMEEGGFPLHLLALFLIAPAMFLMPVILRQFQEKKPIEERTEDLKISLAFPIFITWTMALHLCIPGALWLLDASLAFAMALYVVGIVLCMLEVAFGSEADIARDGTDDWGPRPETSAESWANLRKGISQSFSSGLFIGSMLYVMFALTFPMLGEMDFDAASPLAIIWPVIKACGLSIILFTVLSGVGVLLLTAFVIGFGQWRGDDMIELEDLLQRASGRLFAGGMSWVRPDLESD